MYMTMRTLVYQVNKIDGMINNINKRISGVEFDLAEVENNKMFKAYSRSLSKEISSLYDQKDALIDQKIMLLKMISNRKIEEELFASIIATWMPEKYSLENMVVNGIHIAVSSKNPVYEENKTDKNSTIDKEARKSQIDSRVRLLERLNDEWIQNHGEVNSSIMNLVNELMDERDSLG